MSFFRVEIHFEVEYFSAFLLSEIANLSPNIVFLLIPEKDCFLILCFFLLSPEKDCFLILCFFLLSPEKDCFCEKPFCLLIPRFVICNDFSQTVDFNLIIKFSKDNNVDNCCQSLSKLKLNSKTSSF